VAIKFCCKVDFSATKTVELIQRAYRDAVSSRTDDNIVAVDKMVKEDRNVTSVLIVDTIGIPKTVVLRN